MLKNKKHFLKINLNKYGQTDPCNLKKCFLKYNSLKNIFKSIIGKKKSN